MQNHFKVSRPGGQQRYVVCCYWLLTTKWSC